MASVENWRHSTGGKMLALKEINPSSILPLNNCSCCYRAHSQENSLDTVFCGRSSQPIKINGISKHVNSRSKNFSILIKFLLGTNYVLNTADTGSEAL